MTDQTATPAALPPLDKVVKAFMAIKAVRTAKKRAWEAEDAELEAGQDKLKRVMLHTLNQSGLKSAATAEGTVYRTQRIRPSAADWSAVHNWVLEDPDRFEILEKRLKPTFVQQYMDEHDGQLPPGVNVHREFEVSVRRPNNKD